MGIGTWIIIAGAVIGLVLFIALWLINRSVKFMELEEDIREQDEESLHDYFEVERPSYKK